MAICFRETAKEFHLYNEKISYILTVLENGQLGHLYFGKRLKDRESFAHMLNFRARPMSVCAFEHNLDFYQIPLCIFPLSILMLFQIHLCRKFLLSFFLLSQFHQQIQLSFLNILL